MSCCKHCDGWPDEGYCTKQGDCACHNPHPIDRDELLVGSTAHSSSVPQSEWEKRFDLLWGIAPPDTLKANKGADVKDFIQKLLEEKDAEYVRETWDSWTNGRKAGIKDGQLTLLSALEKEASYKEGQRDNPKYKDFFETVAKAEKHYRAEGRATALQEVRDYIENTLSRRMEPTARELLKHLTTLSKRSDTEI